MGQGGGSRENPARPPRSANYSSTTSRGTLRLCRAALTHLKRPFDDLDGFCKSIRDHQATGWATCTVASFFMSLPLLAYTPIDDALAGHRGSSQSGKTHSVPRHATSLHHGARADSSNGTYRSELLRSRSEWRQTQRGRTGPSPIRTAAQ